MKIEDEHVLPCDFVVGHMRFRKGVKLETVRAAAERWFKIASERRGFFEQLTPEQQKAALAYDGPENFGDPEFVNQQLRTRE